MENFSSGLDIKKNNVRSKILGSITALAMILSAQSSVKAQECNQEKKIATSEYFSDTNLFEKYLDTTDFYDLFPSYLKFENFEKEREKNLKHRNSFLKFFWKMITKDDRFGFHEYDEINDELKKAIFKIKKDENYLSNLDLLKGKILLYKSTAFNVNCQLALSYMLSRIEDEKNLYLNPNETSESLLKKNLKYGDILLINKKLDYTDIGTKALKEYDEKYPTVFTHALISIGFDENLDILVRHSTTATEENHNKGVEETCLNDYLQRCGANGYDVCVLRPNVCIIKSILNFSESKIGKQYDYSAALLQGINMQSLNNLNKFNCVEIVTNGIKFNRDGENISEKSSYEWTLFLDIIKFYYSYLEEYVIPELSGKTFPNDFFDYQGLFNPVYMSTVEK